MKNRKSDLPIRPGGGLFHHGAPDPIPPHRATQQTSRQADALLHSGRGAGTHTHDVLFAPHLSHSAADRAASALA